MSKSKLCLPRLPCPFDSGVSLEVSSTVELRSWTDASTSNNSAVSE